VSGTIYRRGKNWTIGYMVDGEQKIEATGTSNKRVAQKILDIRLAEIIEGRFRLPKSNPPKLKQFSDEFLDSIPHQNTRKRYASSVANLRTHFGDARLTEINAERIDEFKDSRLASKVRAATVNRDLAVLRRMLRIAERKRLITFTPFREVEMLEERKERRQPHILTFDEERRLLAVASDLIRALAILILYTGLRSGREGLALKWDDIDFYTKAIRIRQSKTLAGIRSVPMPSLCTAELLRWRRLLGPEFSEYVFANPQHPKTHLRHVRRAWSDALKAVGLEYFWLYDLRHTFASRAIQAGVPPLFVAQIMGHSSLRILQTYAKASDEYRLSAMSKFESFCVAQSLESAARSEKDGTTLIQ
jgi:integrase